MNDRFLLATKRILLLTAVAGGASLAGIAAADPSLGTGTNRANIDLSTLQPAPPTATVAGCYKLPLSQRAFCASQVGWSQLASSHVAINQQASAGAKAEMASCKSLPYSDIFVCEEQAGYGEKVPRALAPNQRIALQNPNAEYKSAVAACKRLPVSDWNTCISQAGYDVRLARAG